jgi:hypothetical protein
MKAVNPPRISRTINIAQKIGKNTKALILEMGLGGPSLWLDAAPYAQASIGIQ